MGASGCEPQQRSAAHAEAAPFTVRSLAVGDMTVAAARASVERDGLEATLAVKALSPLCLCNTCGSSIPGVNLAKAWAVAENRPEYGWRSEALVSAPTVSHE